MKPKLSILVSYWADKKAVFIEQCAAVCKDMGVELDLFIDSGAFSAYTSGATITIDEYAKFLEIVTRHTDVYANLDIIGGSPQANYENQVALENLGFSPMPVHHFKEPISWLQELIEMGYSKIALGGLVKAGRFFQTTYLNSCATLLASIEAAPKIHLFGVSPSPWVTSIYPWDSYDSFSGWGYKYGQIVHPSYGKVPMKLFKGLHNKMIFFKQLIDQLHFSAYTKELLSCAKKAPRGQGGANFWNTISFICYAKRMQDLLEEATFYTVAGPSMCLELFISAMKDIGEYRMRKQK